MLSDSHQRRTPRAHASPNASSAKRSRRSSRARKGRIIVASFASNVPRIQQAVDQRVAVRPQGRVPGAFAAERRALRDRARPLAHSAGARRRDRRRGRVSARASRGHHDGIARRTDGGALAHVGARSPKLKHRAGRHGRDQRDADPRQREERLETINNLCRLGATVIHGTATERAHVRVTPRKKSCLLMLNLVRPEFFIPVHGEYRMLVTHAASRAEDGRRPGERLRDRERRRRRVHRASAPRKSARPTAAT